MAGTLKQIYRGAETVTATVQLFPPPGGHATATFLWDISAITGTWDCALYLDVGGNAIKVAELTGRTTSGLVRIPLTADFNAAAMAIPFPTTVIFTEAVAGSLTSAIYALNGQA